MAQALEITGEAFVVETPATSAPHRKPLRAGMLIGPGQTIETGENTTAVISLLPGMFVQLQPKAVIEIDQLILVKSGQATSFLMDSRAARIRLDRGSLCAITVETYVPTELQISTRAGTVIATEKASFYLSATTEFVRLTNVESRLGFRSIRDNATKSLEPGHFETWDLSGMTLSEAQSVESQADASEQFKTARGLEVKMSEFVSRMAKTGVRALQP
jgi:hypothetical protein